MLLVALPFWKTGGGYPSVTLGSVDIGGNGVYGYAASGGFVASLGLGTGGTLSSTLLPGFTTTDIIDFGDGANLVFTGDATSALAGITTFKLNGVDHALGSPSFNSGRTIIVAATATLAVATYTVQLA